MNLFGECIKNEFHRKLVKHCKERSCKLQMDINSSFVILKGEKIAQNEKICDCFIIFSYNSRILLALVELKNKSIHRNEIEQKFKNSLKYAKELMNKCEIKEKDVDLVLILLKKGIKSSEFQVLRDIKFNRRKIFIKKCGIKISEILKIYYN